jgi:hypoxanthine phosphoribosyltransferase
VKPGNGKPDIAALGRIRDESELIHSPEAVERALDRIAAAVTERLGASDPVLLAVMTGGMIPAVWLSTRLRFPHQLDYVHATRYVGSTRGGELRWLARPRLALAGRAVLIVDDILDEGITLREIAAYCRAQGASQVSTAVLVRKRHDRLADGVEADFVGLEVPDRYVFGCGMDYHEYFRELRGIHALAPEAEDQP